MLAVGAGLSFIVSGNASIDEYYLVDSIPGADEAQEARDFFKRLGGAATNVAVALARLGARVVFAGVVGNDEQGDLIVEYLRKEGVATHGIVRSQKPTGRVVILLDSRGNRAMVAVRGANLDLKPGVFDPDTLLREVGHVHLSSTKPEYTLWMLAEAKKRGLTTSYDPGMAIASRGLEYLTPVFETTDVLFVNIREYHALGGKRLEDAYRGILVVKEGERGSRIPRFNIEVPAFRVDAIDTTGAGDAFNAAFLIAWKLGLPYERCLLLANAAGALKSTRVGAHSSPTLEELNDFLLSRGLEPLVF